MIPVLSRLPGLRPYNESDSTVFFGRSRDIDVIAANLRSQTLTVLYGPRGVGKTSVLRAGVIPVLRSLPQPVRHAVVIFDCSHPGDSLRDAIDRELEPDSLKDDEPRRTIRAWIQRTGGRAFLILDHVEKLFSVKTGSEAPLLHQVADIVSDPELSANLLLSINETSLFELESLRPRIPLLFENLLRLDYLTRGAARELIRSAYEGEGFRIDDARIEEILEGARMPSGPPSSAPAWDPATLQMVLNHGGSPGGEVWQDFVNRALTSLPSSQQLTAARAILFLVMPGGDRLTRTAEDLAAVTSRQPSDVRQILSRLVDQRILIAETRGGIRPEFYTVAHDLLAERLLQWSHQVLNRHRKRRWIAISTGVLPVALAVIYLILMRGCTH